MKNHSCNISEKLEEVIGMDAAPGKQVWKRGVAERCMVHRIGILNI